MRPFTRRTCALLLSALMLTLGAPHASAFDAAAPPGYANLHGGFEGPGETVHLTHIATGPNSMLAASYEWLFLRTDQSHWEQIGILPGVTGIDDLIWAGDRWVVAAKVSAGQAIFESKDGRSWTTKPLPGNLGGQTTLSLGAHQIWLANGNALWHAPLATMAWSKIETPPHFHPMAVAADDRRVVVVGQNAAPAQGGSIFLLQAPGDWLQVASTPERLNAASVSDGTFIAGGRMAGAPVGHLWTSTDGGPWTQGAFQAVDELEAIPGFGFVGLPAVNSSRRNVIWSRDGEHWITGDVGPTHVYDVTWLDGQVIGVGAGIHSAFGPFCTPYIDLASSDQSCRAVQRLTGANLVQGLPGKQFLPTGPLTRGELATILVRRAGSTLRPNPVNATNPEWSIRDGWVDTAVALHLYPDDKGWAWEGLSRGTLLKTVLKAAGIQPLPNVETGYADVPMGDPLAPWLAAARQAKLIGPAMPYSSFPPQIDPQGPPSPLWTEPQLGAGLLANRAEAAMLLANLLERSK